MSSPICVYFYQLYHYPLHYMYMNLKYIQHKQQHSKTCSFKVFHTCSFKVFHNENWGKISYYPVLPSTAISGSIAQPGKTQVFFSWAVNTLPTLCMVTPHCLNKSKYSNTLGIHCFLYATQVLFQLNRCTYLERWGCKGGEGGRKWEAEWISF